MSDKGLEAEVPISEQLAEVLRGIKKTQDEVGKVRAEVGEVREEVDRHSNHPSQNGGWKALMEEMRRMNGHLEKIDSRMDELDLLLKNPTDGTMAQIKELREWRERANATLDGNRKQDERLLRLELQLQIYNKITWAIGLGVLGLIIKAFMGLIVPGA